ncbi:MAG: translation initiation factor IF-3 [Verrucomicrobia bacterium]|nr:translation initiation factor IF-3 [Verrucomicrobiota bacterium]
MGLSSPFVPALRPLLPRESHSIDQATLSRPFPSRSFPSREPKHRRNGKIRAREVRVLDESKQQLGIMALGDALRLAHGKGLDLVEIAPNAVPPVCRLVQYGKLLYEEAKSHKQSRNTGGKMKEVQLSAGIDPHDFSIKLDQATEFLRSGMKVRVKLRFRGRQRVHKELGFELVNRFVQGVAACGQADAPPRMLGDRDLNVMLSPLAREKRARETREAPPPAASPVSVPPAPPGPISGPPPEAQTSGSAGQ